MCLIRTYEDDIDYRPARRVVHADSYHHRRRRRRSSVSYSPPPPVIGTRRRLSISPVRSIRERLSRVSVEEVRPHRRPSVQFSQEVVTLPKPPTPPLVAPRVVREKVEVLRDGASSVSSASSSGLRGRGYATSTVRRYETPVRNEKEYVVHRTSVDKNRVRAWSPVSFNVDTSRQRSRSRSRKQEYYYEDPRGSGVYRRGGEKIRSYW